VAGEHISVSLAWGSCAAGIGRARAVGLPDERSLPCGSRRSGTKSGPPFLFGGDWIRRGTGRDGGVPRIRVGLVKNAEKTNCQLWHENGGLEPPRASADADASSPVPIGWPGCGAFALSGEKTEGWLADERARTRYLRRDQTAGYARRSLLEGASGRGFDSPRLQVSTLFSLTGIYTFW